MKKILVIEDRAPTRNLFLAGLKAEGFYAIGAENGSLGVQQAQKQLPDLIICQIIQRFSIGWSIATAGSEPANNILGGHCSKSIRNRLV